MLEICGNIRSDRMRRKSGPHYRGNSRGGLFAQSQNGEHETPVMFTIASGVVPFHGSRAAGG
jgi:hypothetical protein